MPVVAGRLIILRRNLYNEKNHFFSMLLFLRDLPIPSKQVKFPFFSKPKMFPRTSRMSFGQPAKNFVLKICKSSDFLDFFIPERNFDNYAENFSPKLRTFFAERTNFFSKVSPSQNDILDTYNAVSTTLRKISTQSPKSY